MVMGLLGDLFDVAADVVSEIDWDTVSEVIEDVSDAIDDWTD